MRSSVERHYSVGDQACGSNSLLALCTAPAFYVGWTDGVFLHRSHKGWKKEGKKGQ